MRNVFLKSAIITAIIFFIGIYLGTWLDSNRLQEIKTSLSQNEVDLDDIRLQSIIFQSSLGSKTFCNAAFKSNLDLNGKAYDQWVKIEEYEKSNRFDTSSLTLEKIRYNLLQLQFWVNSINIKNECNTNYSNVVYFHLGEEPISDSVRIEQSTLWTMLQEIKTQCGDKIMLIPLQTDLNIGSINLVLENYNVTQMPAVLINDKTVLYGLHQKSEILGYLNC